MCNYQATEVGPNSSVQNIFGCADVRWLDDNTVSCGVRLVDYTREVGNTNATVSLKSEVGAIVSDMSSLLVRSQQDLNGAEVACRERGGGDNIPGIAGNETALHTALRLQCATEESVRLLLNLGGAELANIRGSTGRGGDASHTGTVFPIEVAASNLTTTAGVYEALAEAWGMKSKDSKGRTAIQLATGSANAALRRWAAAYGTFLSRYRMDAGPPIHKSQTARTSYAVDEKPPMMRKYVGVKIDAPVVALDDGVFTSYRGRLGTVLQLEQESAKKVDGKWTPFYRMQLKWLDDLTLSDSTEIKSDTIGPVVASAADLEEDPHVAIQVELRKHLPLGGDVVLKEMRHRAQFEREIRARVVEGGVLSQDHVVGVRGWHTPADKGFTDPRGQLQEHEHSSCPDFPYIIILDRCERSLHDACAKERLAGYDSNAVVATLRCVASCLNAIHCQGVVHGDIKQRNILRVAQSGNWILCDMDASARIGEPIGEKTSSAYAPPELAKSKFVAEREAGCCVRAEPSFDVWSFGVLLFELCAGRTLFSQDTSNDALVEGVDRTRLCVWNTISAGELSPIFAPLHDQINPQLVADAKILARWCLQGDPRKRPSLAQIQGHRFLNPLATPPPQIPMRYHGFLSHAQADASGTVGTLYFAYKQLGLHTWLDMRQQQLTLEGMRQGVADSDVFLLVLSQHVLASWFCQQEMLHAIELGKPIQLILEQEPRFHPFDVDAWVVRKGESERTVKSVSGAEVAVPSKICAMIDTRLRAAVTYRRRDFEVESMMRELCRRNGLVLPRHPMTVTDPSAAPHRVFVVHNAETASGVMSAVSDVLLAPDARVCFVDDVVSSDRVLLILTPGVLQPPVVRHLMAAIARDRVLQQDTIVAVFSESAGWRFGCEEQRNSSEAVQACLNEHEALAYRSPDPGGANCHEFPAVAEQLLSRILGLSNGLVLTTETRYRCSP